MFSLSVGLLSLLLGESILQASLRGVGFVLVVAARLDQKVATSLATVKFSFVSTFATAFVVFTAATLLVLWGIVAGHSVFNARVHKAFSFLVEAFETLALVSIIHSPGSSSLASLTPLSRLRDLTASAEIETQI